MHRKIAINQILLKNQFYIFVYIFLVSSSQNMERVRMYRARLTEDEKIVRKAKDAERKRDERKDETLEEKKKRLQKSNNKIKIFFK